MVLCEVRAEVEETGFVIRTVLCEVRAEADERVEYRT